MAVLLFHSYFVLVDISLTKFKMASWDYLETKDDCQSRKECGLRRFCHSVRRGSLEWGIQAQKLALDSGVPACVPENELLQRKAGAEPFTKH